MYKRQGVLRGSGGKQHTGGRHFHDTAGFPGEGAVIVPVSYTHLDVYKRQVNAKKEAASKLEKKADFQSEMSNYGNLLKYVDKFLGELRKQLRDGKFTEDEMCIRDRSSPLSVWSMALRMAVTIFSSLKPTMRPSRLSTVCIMLMYF